MTRFQFVPKKPSAPNHTKSLYVESLEIRQFLSTSAAVAHPNLIITPMAGISTVVQGYTPSQIRHAYGFDQISGTGAGQTIAIVDAYNDPNIAADLHTFDQKFGLADPNLQVESQSGGAASSVRTDAGWAGEIALDVEWAHSVAPGANILLVEANSSTLNDLMTAVDTARKASGVSVVSMSWGGSEFRGQTQYDSIFTTPAGHQGVTFVAASGDSGSWYGPEWPATSPNVLAVGGTTLLTTANGTYSSETGWSGSGGGISTVYRTPSYQAGAQSTGMRTNPDVSYNANPYTGFAVYDSLAYQGILGWQDIGGTSAGAPQWAALIALADQSRAAAGKGSLDGAGGTLPALYKLYSTSTSYAASFNDITTGASSNFLRAHAGYDGVAGLGTPKAPQVVAALTGAVSTATNASVSTTTRIAALQRASTVATSPDATRTNDSGAAARIQPSTGLVASPIRASTASYASTYVVKFNNPAQSPPAASSLASAPAVSAHGDWQISGSPVTLSTVITAAARLARPTTLAVSALSNLDSPRVLGLISDEMMSLIRDSLSPAAVERAIPTNHTRAWAITAATIFADAVVIASWVGSRRQARHRKAEARVFAF